MAFSINISVKDRASIFFSFTCISTGTSCNKVHSVCSICIQNCNAEQTDKKKLGEAQSWWWLMA